MFLIRADGNETIGAGHIMRCMAIGAAAGKQGLGEAVFVCADEGSAGLVRQQGFEAHVLGTDYRDMESELSAWERMAAASGLSVRGAAQPLILVDSYYATDRYLEGLKRFGRVALMEDIEDTRRPVDILINYNVTADPESYRKRYLRTETRLLLGSAYVPLREQFSDRDYRVREKVRVVLITAGGGDSGNIAGRLLDRLFDEKLEFHLTAGCFNPHYEALKQMEQEHENIHIHRDVSDMAELMLTVDVAVSAGGSTIYELAALGVPFVCFSCAENQEPQAEYIGVHEVSGYAGAFHRDAGETEECVYRLFLELTADADRRRQYHRRERELVDGRGAKRLALALTGADRGRGE